MRVFGAAGQSFVLLDVRELWHGCQFSVSCVAVCSCVEKVCCVLERRQCQEAPRRYCMRQPNSLKAVLGAFALLLSLWTVHVSGVHVLLICSTSLLSPVAKGLHAAELVSLQLSSLTMLLQHCCSQRPRTGFAAVLSCTFHL